MTNPSGERSWRSDAADRLRALLEQPAQIDRSDGELLAVVALELSGEELGSSKLCQTRLDDSSTARNTPHDA
jgi:hypothetical protein